MVQLYLKLEEKFIVKKITSISDNFISKYKRNNSVILHNIDENIILERRNLRN